LAVKLNAPGVIGVTKRSSKIRMLLVGILMVAVTAWIVPYMGY